MQLYPDFSEAMDKGFTRYLNQSTNEPLHILAVSVSRRRFFTVISTKEAAKHKISIKNVAWSIGATEEAKKAKEDFKNYQPDKQTKLLLSSIKNYRSYRNAEEKLRKMGRERESSQGQSEVYQAEEAL